MKCKVGFLFDPITATQFTEFSATVEGSVIFGWLVLPAIVPGRSVLQLDLLAISFTRWCIEKKHIVSGNIWAWNILE